MTISGEVNVRQGISGDLQMPRVVSGGSTTVDSELSSTSENPVQNKVIKSALDGKGTYSKPSGGIPKSDLASEVQTSLGKADTAVQTAQGAGNAGKFLVVGANGNITLVTMTAWQGGSY